MKVVKSIVDGVGEGGFVVGGVDAAVSFGHLFLRVY